MNKNMQILVADTNEEFLKDLSMEIYINNEDINPYVKVVHEVEKFKNLITKYTQEGKVLRIFISSEMAEAISSKTTGDSVSWYGYTHNLESEIPLKDKGIDYIGKYKTVGALIKLFFLDTIPITTPANNCPNSVDIDAQMKNVFAENNMVETKPSDTQEYVAPKTPQADPEMTAKQLQSLLANIGPKPTAPAEQPIIPTTVHAENPMSMADLQKMILGLQQSFNQLQSAGGTVPQPQQAPQPQQTSQAAFMPEGFASVQSNPQPTPYAEPEYSQQNTTEQLLKMHEEKRNAYLDNRINQDKMGGFANHIKTKVITVFSSKGGVGKTTISTELASILANINNGRKRLNVCIVDYNIDYGDVCLSLKYNYNDVSMFNWAQDISCKLHDGTKASEITYSKEQIHSYLQQSPETGLYALIAPTNYADSVAIDTTAIHVMADNLIKYGGFDYVVFDTGNNTRDCTIKALKMADYIYIVVTQDINTLNGNMTVIQSFPELGIDVNKVKLIFNKIISTKEANISVEEAEENLKIPCVARVKNTSEIIRAINDGRTLVSNKRSKFSEQLYPAVKYILSGQIDYQQKKPFFRKR